MTPSETPTPIPTLAPSLRRGVGEAEGIDALVNVEVSKGGALDDVKVQTKEVCDVDCENEEV